ncbi:chromosome segregation protein SMC [Alteromonas oceanisediminis]|uniref:chromosome segregation protein SMC n=1 Tax=Alteromonas oceanisediminis TaxID=2836180 RepID=UPI001BD91C04|nr:chromosome segregation protein SMC [Alteromonas oceanisediminis]MBT0586506.1 chromosome segregation protein SMC [Alteromonas oceanisediminis]
MRLKRIKLAGFKSFVDATSIPFPGDMTAIVGPNGCGKSNVIDAVRWVLGESSAKNLRGDAMTDVIFSGSSARKSVSQCSVELIFDNASGRIQGEFARYNEIAVKRVVTRDAQSSYWLNGSRCRRRDVTDLFLGTGLGPRSYAIIEQGMISRLIESKPQELRVFIEEAAGISKYKERRRETETRIRHTRENLERLEDVRSELTTQLDKLHRQAQAARRYKELKAVERNVKSELAALKWAGYSERVDNLTQKIHLAETDYEALVASQRRDEALLSEQRQIQADTKHAIEDLQQQLFTIGTHITRLEQSRDYAQQRHQELNAEAQEQRNKLALEATELEALSSLREASATEVERLEPALEILQEQAETALRSRDTAERKLTDFGREYQVQEQAHQQLKQQAQSYHSQIQSTMSMQLRTQQRMTEIEQELSFLDHEERVRERAQAKIESNTLAQQRDEASDAYEAACSQRVDLQAKHDALKVSEQQISARQQRFSAEIEGLKSLQDDLSDKTSAALKSQGFTQVWQQLAIEKGFERLFDRVAEQWNEAFVIESEHEFYAQAKSASVPMVSFNSAWTSHKVEGSLAQRVTNERVPSQLNHILVADSAEAARAVQKRLEPHQSVISEEGPWLGVDWLRQLTVSAPGKAVRSARIAECEMLLAEADQEKAVLEQQLKAAIADLADNAALCRDTAEAVEKAKHAFLQAQNRVSMLTMQIEQQSSREKRLQDDLVEQKRLLAKEQQQLDALSARVADVEERLLDFEAEQLHYEKSREQCEAAVTDARSQLEHIKSELHRQTLSLQQLHNELTRLKEKHESLSTVHTERKERLQKIEQEQAKLLLPSEQQQDEIEALLKQREDVALRQSEKQATLADIEQQLREGEKKHANDTQDLHSQHASIERLRLDCEGYKVRAASVLEQLSETQQTLSAALERLPDDASEEAWNTKLESTKAAVSRLGAVNLAAVEEFEAQAARKAHLDTQFDDLQHALDTLEEAIRKIDRETKDRFSRTFEQVNDDLKTLFPKVFGGGSAYLALTGEDLLETGVTIMARPPGKKNTTIHLLSGGEKALTALSLVFAIFRLNPAPFCLLDEVDAPLDDANVGRFCRLVSEMSKTVQFIYITHNKIAMEMAEHLTGVTMSEPGVSRMVAVDVEEAVAIANA